MAGILGDDADTPPPQAPAPQITNNYAAQPQAPGLPNMGIMDRLQAQYAPGAYKARVGAYQQNLALQTQAATYQALAGMGYSPEQARMLSLSPSLATEALKPQLVNRGTSLVNPMAPGGGGAGGAGGAGNASAGGSGAQPGASFTNTQGDLQGAGLQQIVERSLLGEDVTQEVGRDPVNRAIYNNAMGEAMKQRGITAATLADRNAKFPAYKNAVNDLTKSASERGVGASEFQALAPHLAQSVTQFNTQFPKYNAFKQAVAKGMGGPQATALQQQINGVMAAYGRATGNKDDAHVEDVLNKTWSGGQIQAGIQALQQEIQATQAAIPKQMNRLKVQHGLADKVDAPSLSNARAAIAKGAPRDQVRQKIEEAGLDPGDL